jgi:hypothetical protein
MMHVLKKIHKASALMANFSPVRKLRTVDYLKANIIVLELNCKF